MNMFCFLGLSNNCPLSSGKCYADKWKQILFCRGEVFPQSFQIILCKPAILDKEKTLDTMARQETENKDGGLYFWMRLYKCNNNCFVVRWYAHTLLELGAHLTFISGYMKHRKCFCLWLQRKWIQVSNRGEEFGFFSPFFSFSISDLYFHWVELGYSL